MIRLNKKFLRLMAVMHTSVALKGLLIYFGYRYGNILDQRYDTGSLFMLIGMFGGAAIGLGWIIFMVMRYGK